MTKFKLILLLPIALLAVTCSKDRDPIEEAIEESKERCYKDISLTCSGALTNSYFKGKINGQEFCVSADVDGYLSRNGLGTQGIVEVGNGPVVIDPQKDASGYLFTFAIQPRLIQIGDEGALYYEKEFLPGVWINSPIIKSSEAIAPTKLIDSLIFVGDRTLVKEAHFLEPETFTFVIDWQCDQLYPNRIPERYNLYEHRVSVGYSPQGRKKENYTFKIVEFEREEFLFSVKYTVKFNIECDLFNGDNRKFVGRLTEGEFRTEFALLK